MFCSLLNPHSSDLLSPTERLGWPRGTRIAVRDTDAGTWLLGSDASYAFPSSVTLGKLLHGACSFAS